jgi:hypothetical protein
MKPTLEEMGYPSDPGHDHTWSPWRPWSGGMKASICGVCTLTIVRLAEAEDTMLDVRLPVTRHHIVVVD